MRKKRISTVLIALVVAVGIPSSAFAADIGTAKGTTGEGMVVTTQVNGQAISSTGSNESVKPDTTTVEESGSREENESTIENGNSTEQNKDGVKGESGNLPVAEEPAVEEPAVQEPEVEEPAIEEPKAEEPVAEKPTVTEPAIVVEEPVVTEPAIVEEPVVTEPAIVVEEPVVTEPAIVVEPVTLTIVHRLTINEDVFESTQTIDNLQVGSEIDLSQYIQKGDGIRIVGETPKITVSEKGQSMVLEYEYTPDLYLADIES